MYKCKHFCIEELVSPKTYELKGEKCWRWFPEKALRGLDALRDEFGGMTINNWKWGGNRRYSGFHLPSDPQDRSQFSGHRQWQSFDCIFADHSAEEVRIKLLGHEPVKNGYLPQIERHPDITEIEIGVNWLHVRFNSNVGKQVLVYRP